MLLHADDRIRITRQGTATVAQLLAPHRVVAAAIDGGGERLDLTHLGNHQSCEGAAHHARSEVVHRRGPDGYHRVACEQAGLPPATTMLLGTAAHQQNTAIEQRGDRELQVTVVATAGVSANAACAGDPAAWQETATGWQSAPPTPGTINVLAFLSRPATGGCLARALVQLAEGKADLLRRLHVPSRQSHRLATGTGTDQSAVAAPLADGPELTWPGHHSRLGELLVAAQRAALTTCLQHQQGLDFASRRSVAVALGRFGWQDAWLVAHAHDAALMQANLLAVVHEAQAVAAAYAAAQALDLGEDGVLPPLAVREAVVHQAALAGAAIACRPVSFAAIREQVAASPAAPAELVALGMALGFAAKW